MRFSSFYWAGFECSTGWNASRNWFDQIEATQHEVFADQDYAACAAARLTTVREGVRWPLVDGGGKLDFRSVAAFVHAAERHGIQVVWDLFHYGYPSDLDPFSDAFVERFATYCFETARYLASRLEGPLVVTPVNEPSYLAYAGGEARLFPPFLTGTAWELKVQLCRAAIRGLDAIWEACPSAIVVNADPICRQAAPLGCEDVDDCHRFNEEVVFESLDMLAGRLLPELGGSTKHLGIVGMNYYWTNQWEVGSPERPLLECDERCWPLLDLIRWVSHRYDTEIVVTETAHSEPNKAWWIEEVACAAECALNEGIPLRGVCLYPILGMPEWHEPETWAQMGLWEVETDAHGMLRRKLDLPMYRNLRAAQQRIAAILERDLVEA